LASSKLVLDPFSRPRGPDPIVSIRSAQRLTSDDWRCRISLRFAARPRLLGTVYPKCH
jgi:hypothetical protein